MASAGIFKQSMGARNRVGIGSLESILKSLKIRAQQFWREVAWLILEFLILHLYKQEGLFLNETELGIVYIHMFNVEQ